MIVKYLMLNVTDTKLMNFVSAFFGEIGYMSDFLGRLGAQYWFWFVRNELVLQELVSIQNQLIKIEPFKKQNRYVSDYNELEARKSKLHQLEKDALVDDIFTLKLMQDQFLTLSNGVEYGSNFDAYGSKFKNGNRAVSKTILKMINKIVPGSTRANEKGPGGLFLILNAESLTEAVYVVKEELSAALQSNLNLQNGKFNLKTEELLTMLSMGGRLSIFSGTMTLLKALNDVFNSLYPTQEWESFTTVVSSPKTSIEDLNPDELLQTDYLPIAIAAPILIGFAYIRARFFGETHYLSKVCFEEQYLKFLHKQYLMKKELWYSLEEDKSSEKSHKTIGSIIKGTFQTAYRQANPVFFSTNMKDIE